MWSAHRKKVARLAIILQPSSIQHNYQGQCQGKQLLSPPSPHWSHILSQWIRTPLKPKFHVGLAVNIQLCHPASMISTCRPTQSMGRLLWPWSERMNNTAPNHRSHPFRVQFRRRQWLWVPLKAGRQHTQQPTMPRSILTMSPKESIGIFLQATPLTPKRQERYLSLPALPPHGRLHDDKKKAEHGDVFPKEGECRSTPARHAASPYQPKRHPNAQKKLKHYILLIKL